MNSVQFINGNGGSGQSPTGFDGYSALVAYYKAASAVSAYSAIGNKIYNSLADAESDGINASFSDATAASSALTVSNKGAASDSATITVSDWVGNTYTLCSVTIGSTPADVTASALLLINAINANTYLTGFSAVASTAGVLIITSPITWGVYLNTKSVTITFSASPTWAITNVAFGGSGGVSGVGSRLANWHYQISEYFRKNQNSSPLYFSIKLDNTTTNTTTTLFNTQLTSDLQVVQSAFGSAGSFGMARQIMVLSNERTFATSTIDAIQAAKVALDALIMNCSFGYIGDTTASALSAFVNLATLTDYGVNCVISQSGSGVGLDLINTNGKAIGAAGAWLGTVSGNAVSQNIAEVGVNNISDGSECETPVFMDSALTPFTTILTGSLPAQLDAYRYNYLGKYPNKTGTYWNEDFTCIANTNQFFKLSRVRVVDKVKRGQYTDLLPLLNSRFTRNSDGTISDASAMAFSDAAYNTPSQMMKNQSSGSPDLSPATESQVIPSVTYSVSTGKIAITTNLLPIGQAEGIVITEQFVTKYTS